MTFRSLLLVPIAAAAMALAPHFAVIAQEQEQPNSPPANSPDQKAPDATPAPPQNAPSNEQSDSPIAQQSKSEVQTQSKTDSQPPQGASNNNPTGSPNQPNQPNRNAKSDSQQPGDRSVLSDRNRDDQSDRSKNDADRNSDNRTFGRDNKANQQTDKNRDFRRDFKFGKSVNRGLAIASVVRGSIFYNSGLRDGDIIVSYNGRPIRTQDDFARFVVYQPGQRVPIIVLRDGREETIYVEYRDDVARNESGRVYFGAEFDPRVNDAAVISRVDEDSPAAHAGLQVDDVVIALGGNRISTPRDALAIIDSTNPGERLIVEFSRHGRTEVMLGGPGSGAARTETKVYRQADNDASIAVGVDADGRRVEADSNREQKSDDRDRRDDRRGGRGLLPRLRN